MPRIRVYFPHQFRSRFFNELLVIHGLARLTPPIVSIIVTCVINDDVAWYKATTPDQSWSMYGVARFPESPCKVAWGSQPPCIGNTRHRVPLDEIDDETGVCTVCGNSVVVTHDNSLGVSTVVVVDDHDGDDEQSALEQESDSSQ